MDTTINNEMFNSLLDRVERLANPLNAPVVETKVTPKAPCGGLLPPLYAKLVNILKATTYIGDPPTYVMHFANNPDDNITLTEFRQILSALGIEG